jgi:hypothetical protein
MRTHLLFASCLAMFCEMPFLFSFTACFFTTLLSTFSHSGPQSSLFYFKCLLTMLETLPADSRSSGWKNLTWENSVSFTKDFVNIFSTLIHRLGRKPCLHQNHVLQQFFCDCSINLLNDK